MLPSRSSGLVVVVLLATLFSTGAALRCYIGTETNAAIDCIGSCLKTSMIDDEDWVMRSCWPSRKDDRCDVTSMVVQTESCYCNTDYCNASSPSSLPSLLLLAPIILSFLLRHVY